MLNQILAIFSTLIISLVSLLGVVTLSVKPKKLQGVLIYLVSCAVGAMFGDAFIHLVPEAYGKLENKAPFYILFGVLFFFVLEKLVKWHHCHKIDCKEHFRPVASMNLGGDGLHNLVDGLLIGATFLVGIPVGLSTALAVLAHEIPQEIGDFAILLHGGYSVKKALFYNFLSALTAMLGVLLSLLLGPVLKGYDVIVTAITAGGFIYIAGSDLIPELHHEESLKKAFKQLLAILLGIGAMFALTFLE